MKAIAATVGAAGRTDFFWLDQNFAMMASSPKRGLGFNLRFGGIFTSVPAAVASMAPHDMVVATGITTAAAEIIAPASATVTPAPSTAARRPAGVNVGGLTGGIRPMTQRIDLFGLGLDYAMYHKMFWGSFDQDDLSGWQNLGGVFTSAPAAINWAGSRVDVFGVGMDHAMYTKTRVSGDAWSPNWLRLGGTFTSTATMVSHTSNQLDIFARGADFTLRGNHTDGSTWFGWQNHGGSLASPPVAVSWGANRIDVFAIFNDATLRHMWWDGQIWNDWESLGGNYAGEPAVATWAPGRLDVFVQGAADGKLHHHWFSNDAWSNPETMNIGSQQGLAGSPTVISTAANHLEVFVPTVDTQIRIGKWDGSAWNFGSAGANFRSPSRYRMSVDQVHVKNTRALNSDTDAAMVSVAAGNAAAQIRTQWIGDIGGVQNPKTSQTNLLHVDSVTVDLAEPMSFSYLVVNNGHAAQDKILASLASAGNSLSLAGSSSMQDDIAKGVVKIISVKLVAAIAISVPVVGSVLGLIENWLLGKLTDIAFQNCDGVVAVELRAMMGRDLYLLTDSGRKTVTVTTDHPGTDSATGCGANSDYEVTWTIKPL
jgi:hypothetical protein